MRIGVLNTLVRQVVKFYINMCLCRGQVLFSKVAEEKIKELLENPSTDEKRKRAAVLLQNTMNVINQVDTHTNTLTHTEAFRHSSTITR